MLFSKYPDDIKRFQEMVNDRRKIIDNTPATPLPKTYAVNELYMKLKEEILRQKNLNYNHRQKNMY